MKKILLLFVAGLTMISCDKDIVEDHTLGDPEPFFTTETTDLEQDAIDQALENPGNAGRSSLPTPLLGSAEETTTWVSPWWIQEKVGGFGLHYPENPYFVGSLEDNPFLRGRAWLFSYEDGKVAVIQKSEDAFLIIFPTGGGQGNIAWSSYSKYLTPVEVDLAGLEGFIVNSTNNYGVAAYTIANDLVEANPAPDNTAGDDTTLLAPVHYNAYVSRTYAQPDLVFPIGIGGGRFYTINGKYTSYVNIWTEGTEEKVPFQVSTSEGISVDQVPSVLSAGLEEARTIIVKSENLNDSEIIIGRSENVSITSVSLTASSNLAYYTGEYRPVPTVTWTLEAKWTDRVNACSGIQTREWFRVRFLAENFTERNEVFVDERYGYGICAGATGGRRVLSTNGGGGSYSGNIVRNNEASSLTVRAFGNVVVGFIPVGTQAEVGDTGVIRLVPEGLPTSEYPNREPVGGTLSWEVTSATSTQYTGRDHRCSTSATVDTFTIDLNRTGDIYGTFGERRITAGLIPSRACTFSSSVANDVRIVRDRSGSYTVNLTTSSSADLAGAGVVLYDNGNILGIIDLASAVVGTSGSSFVPYRAPSSVALPDPIDNSVGTISLSNFRDISFINSDGTRSGIDSSITSTIPAGYSVRLDYNIFGGGVGHALFEGPFTDRELAHTLQVQRPSSRQNVAYQYTVIYNATGRLVQGKRLNGGASIPGR